MNNLLEIIQPDDWHIHLREGDMLELVVNFSSRINNRCVAMPNTIDPITTYKKAQIYRDQIMMGDPYGALFGSAQDNLMNEMINEQYKPGYGLGLQ